MGLNSGSSYRPKPAAGSTAISREDIQMSLDVYLDDESRFQYDDHAVASRTINFLREDERRFQFDDNAVYWFLHPWFLQLHKSIGKYIDLYGGTTFSAADGLSLLIQAMDEAKIAAENQPQEIQVTVAAGCYEKTHRSVLLEEIIKFQALLEEAKMTGKTLCFGGD